MGPTAAWSAKAEKILKQKPSEHWAGPQVAGWNARHQAQGERTSRNNHPASLHSVAFEAEFERATPSREMSPGK